MICNKASYCTSKFVEPSNIQILELGEKDMCKTKDLTNCNTTRGFPIHFIDQGVIRECIVQHERKVKDANMLI